MENRNEEILKIVQDAYGNKVVKKSEFTRYLEGAGFSDSDIYTFGSWASNCFRVSTKPARYQFNKEEATQLKTVHILNARDAKLMIRKAPAKTKFYFLACADLPIDDKPGMVFPDGGMSVINIGRPGALKMVGDFLKNLEERGARIKIQVYHYKSSGSSFYIGR